jgi:hypothetical protein
MSPLTLCTSITRLVVSLAATAALGGGWGAGGHRLGRERLNYEVGERRSPQDLAICIRLDNYKARERFGHYCPV